ncbi:hypothetical protein GQ53DRAFT_818195 [Thozetella sp. PMI_491]|nr:hypothetical protein GQ53DRAFT_818195 [Thozetella sp. PMI_491]
MKRKFQIAAAAGCTFLAVAESKLINLVRDETTSWLPVGKNTAEPPQINDLKRQAGSGNTCGYINGVGTPESAITCALGNNCYADNVNSFIGCCSAQHCTVQTSCIDSSNSAFYFGDSTHTLYCSDSKLPACAVLAYTDRNSFAYAGYTCDSTATTYTVSYLLAGQAPVTSTRVSVPETTEVSSGSYTPHSLTGPTNPSLSSSSTSASSPSPSDATSSSTSSSSNFGAGAIAGLVCGIIVLLGVGKHLYAEAWEITI